MRRSPLHIAFILGTRPEIIKLSPLILLAKAKREIRVTVVATGQHREMAAQAWSTFDIKPDIPLNLMEQAQTPTSFLASLIIALEPQLIKAKPDLVIVQGDTTSALGGAICAFHLKLPVAHIEAGLRTFDQNSPFPEEMNRVLISRIATHHFCVTDQNKKNLFREGTKENIHVVGNTIVDAVNIVKQKLARQEIPIDSVVKGLQPAQRRYILVTGHRRENFTGPLENVCRALGELVSEDNSLEVVFPVHLNPVVQKQVKRVLGGHPRIHLLPPVSFPSMLLLLKHCLFAVSDSGGMQEEAPSFGKRVLVTRSSTERPEAIKSGFATLAPISSPLELLTKIQHELKQVEKQKLKKVNPFGDGKSSARILKLLLKR